MRARLLRYSLWQLRDCILERSLPSLIVASLIFMPVLVQHRAFRQMPTFGVEEFARESLRTVAPSFVFLLVLLAVNGIISNDRKSGAYRLLFAKPVSIQRFYAQAFLVNWVGSLLVAAVLLLAYAVLLHPVPPLGLLALVSLQYVSLGGVGFLFSSLARFDWMLMGATYGLSILLRVMFPAAQSWYGRVIDVGLPPFHRVGEVGEALLTGAAPSATTVAWLAGYGAAGFVLGLIVLRTRPMGE